MINETKKNIEAYKALLPGLKERVAAVALMLVMSVVMMTSASYAWLTISRAPEVTGMNTTITGNGNLEIALVDMKKDDKGEYVLDENGRYIPVLPGESAVGDSSATLGQDILSSNVTWGNLVNLSDSRYGLDQISLRPALLSTFNLLQAPLYGVSYGDDGRVMSTTEVYEFASWTQKEDGGYYFAAGSAAKFGVRAISSVKYENITGNAAVNALSTKIRAAYADANTLYTYIILGDTKVADGVSCMDALAMLMEIYVNEKADNVLDTSGKTIYADYGGVVTYTYRLIEEFKKVLDAEGEALLHMANLQVFVNPSNGITTNGYFKSLDDLLSASAATLNNLGVKLDSLATYKTDRNNIDSALAGLKDMAASHDPSLPNPSTEQIYWNKSGSLSMGNHVSKLVNIGTTEINDLPMSSFNGSNIGSVLGVLNAKSHKAVIKDGVLANTEQRLGSMLKDNDIKVQVRVNALSKTLTATVVTDAVSPFLSVNDQTYTSSLEVSGAGGDATAKDTYGMAIDLWVRTNVSGTVLTLEGSLKTQMVPATCTDKEGNLTTLYSLSYKENISLEVYAKEEGEITNYYNAQTHTLIGSSDNLTMENGYTIKATGTTGTDQNGAVVDLYTIESIKDNITDAYRLPKDTGDWYDANSHTLIGSADEIANNSQYSYSVQQVEVVTGFDGENRVWEDWMNLIENGYMAENNTTQGSGSCYVFYADPSDQTRILHLLEAFAVAFIDQNGNKLGTARLDTEHYYSINGKVTVPLVMVDGFAYTDTYIDPETSQTIVEEKIGILPLSQNEATWITAVVYLNGLRLSNQDVLAMGNIEGSLNIQFGSSVALTNQDDEDLRTQIRDISATLTTANGSNSTNSKQPVTLEYQKAGQQVTVTLQVEGEQPKNISAFFVRAISATQGTRGESVAFTPNGDNTWSATFTITKPGTYSLRSVIVDGTEYSLEDGTRVQNGATIPENFPTVVISGMGVKNVYCDLREGIVMTADNYVEAFVSAAIDASGELMPKQVRALFRSSEGKEYTALLSYDSGLDTWTGTAKITESGTYTLQYLVMDGDYTDLTLLGMDTTHIVYVGLTARIWTDALTEFEYQGTAVDLFVRAKLYDNTNEELTSLESVSLQYLLNGSVLVTDGLYTTLTWNALTSYYEGEFELKNAGIYSFDHVAVETNAGTSKISKATVSPTFTAYVTDPPVYDEQTTQNYQFVPNGGATVSLQITNAQTSKMWALIKNVDTGEEKLVLRDTSKDYAVNQQTNLYEFFFDIPKDKEGKQDGNWQLTALYLQGVAKPDPADPENAIWVPVSTEDPTTDNCYVIDLKTENIVTKVVQTVNVTITADNEAVDIGSTIVFGKDENGNITGVFMESYTSNVTFVITDWEGNAIDGISDVKWMIGHNGDQRDKGGYETDRDARAEQKLSANGTTYSAAVQTFQLAGTYPTRLYFKVGDYEWEKLVITYVVYSKLPTIAITAISPTDTFDVDTDGEGSGHTSGGTPSFNATTATVYFKCSRSGSGSTCDPYRHNYTRPSVTITISGMGYATQANLSFGSGVEVYNGTTQTDGYSWTGDGSLSRNIGYYRSRTAANDNKTPAGTISANTLIFVYNGMEYSFAISTLTGANAITINNPY